MKIPKKQAAHLKQLYDDAEQAVGEYRAALNDLKEEAEHWREGFKRARRLGLLDEHNRPTWHQPRWTPKLLREARQALKEVLE